MINYDSIGLKFIVEVKRINKLTKREMKINLKQNKPRNIFLKGSRRNHLNMRRIGIMTYQETKEKEF